MSLDAIRWAFEQPIAKSSTKFVLVTMADCVNAESNTMECWPSYAYLAKRTGQDPKTVEAGVYRLREERYIVDTGKRSGDTGKVVVYRLNDPKTGAIQPGPRIEQAVQSANGTRPQNTPENGVIQGEINPPKFPGNPPKNGDQSPQISGEMTPKTGARSRKGIRKESGTESGLDAACAALPEVPREALKAWLAVRKDKRAGPVTDPVASALRREAEKAGMTSTEAAIYCCEAGWQNFNAGFYARREGKSVGAAPERQESFI